MSLSSTDYKAILNLLPEIYFILDENLRVVESNSEFIKLEDVVITGLIGKNILDIYKELFDFPAFNILSELFKKVQITKQSQVVETKMQLRHESARDRERVLSIKNIPLCEDNKRIKYIIHHVTDLTKILLIQKIERQQHKLNEALITQAGEMEGEIYTYIRKLEERNKELQKMNDALAKSEMSKSRLATIVEFAQDAIITIKMHDGFIDTWNKGAEKLYGYEASEVIGQPVSLIYPENKMHEYKYAFEKLKAGHPVQFFETKLKQKNGRLISVAVTISPLKNDKQEVIGACSIAHDISEFKRSRLLRKKNKELLELSKVKNQFIANVSHELRTPLHGILGFSRLLANDKINPLTEKQKEYISYIIGGSNHLSMLINDILDFTKIEAGKMEVAPANIDIKELIIDTKNIFGDFIKNKNLHFTVNHDPELISVYIDPDKLKQIIYNYLSNAIKFTPVGGNIILSLQVEDKDNFRLTVEDTGIGVKKSDIKKLFVEFQQLDDSAGKEYPGSGLGLAIIQRIANLLGGKVGVVSELNVGSSFYVILPRTLKV